MMEPSRQDRLPRPGRRASNTAPPTQSCGCSHHPPSSQERLYGSALPVVNVQQEPQAALSLDGDGTLLTEFAPPRVVRRFETNRLSGFLDYGRQMVHRSLGSAYSVVHAADLTVLARSARSQGAQASSAFNWPAPEQEGSSSHERFGTDVDWEDNTVPTAIGASCSLDAELAEANPDWPEPERSFPLWRRGALCAVVLLGVVIVTSASQRPVVASADDRVADNLVPTASGGAPLRPDARSPTTHRTVPPPLPPLAKRPALHFIAYQASRALQPTWPPTCLQLQSLPLAGLPMQNRHDQRAGRRARRQAGRLCD